MNTDPISDMLTRIRNAHMARHDTVVIPHSNIKQRIAEILSDEGFVESVTVEGDIKKNIAVTLKYHGRNPVIEHLERVSRPGRRNYVNSSSIDSVQSGLGIAILSTSKGVMVDRQARKEGVGGELLCRIW